MNDEQKLLSVVLPAYKEEKNLELILPQINSVLNRLGITYEVLIIDTMEKMDDTKKVCELNNVRYYNRTGGNNYGDAIRTGIELVQSKYTIFMDADGSHDPEFIEKLFANKEGKDVVIASRYVEGGGTDNSKILILMSFVVNFLYSLILNLKCKDVSNSFKLYRTSDLKDLTLYCNNFDIVEEILFKLKKKKGNLKIKEIPFLFKKRMFGNTKRNLFLFIFTYVITLLKLRFGK